MGRFIDLTGQKFGRLTVIKDSDKRDVGGNVLWECQCDCGNTLITAGGSLRKGLTKSCGCINQEKVRDLKGQIFGKLTAVGSMGHHNGKAHWVCRCECGNFITVYAGHLLSGHTKSCGCYHKERTRSLFSTYASIYPSEYSIWLHIVQRCHNPGNPSYSNYGGRGIKVCDRWIESFENFLEDMGPKPSKHYSIDRIDVNGDYCPENCRWGTSRQQNNNRRNNRRFEYGGVSRTVAQWYKHLNVSPSFIYDRLKKGLSFDKIAEEAINRNKESSCGYRNDSSKSKEYRSWASMKSRCYNSNTKEYKNYGGRGIRICDRWLDKEHGFENFFEDMGYAPSKYHSIDRIDVNGNYCPENCCWATSAEQNSNRRNNCFFEAEGKRITFTQWMRELEVSDRYLRSRLKKGIPFPDIVKEARERYL